MNTAVSLGIDLGTSELKAILMDASGAVLAQAGVRLSVSRRHPGWSRTGAARLVASLFAGAGCVARS